jgi:hypothetical protein
VIQLYNFNRKFKTLIPNNIIFHFPFSISSLSILNFPFPTFSNNVPGEFFFRFGDEHVFAGVEKEGHGVILGLVEQFKKLKVPAFHHAAHQEGPFRKHNGTGGLACGFQGKGVAPDNIAVGEVIILKEAETVDVLDGEKVVKAASAFKDIVFQYSRLI